MFDAVQFYSLQVSFVTRRKCWQGEQNEENWTLVCFNSDNRKFHCFFFCFVLFFCLFPRYRWYEYAASVVMILPSQIDMCLSFLSPFHSTVSSFLPSFQIRTSASYFHPPRFPASQHSLCVVVPLQSLLLLPHKWSPVALLPSPRHEWCSRSCFASPFFRSSVSYRWHFCRRGYVKNSPGKDWKSFTDSHKWWTTERIIWNCLQTEYWEKTQLLVSLNVSLHVLYIPLLF